MYLDMAHFRLHNNSKEIDMNMLTIIFVVAILTISIAGLSACEKQNSAEAVGEKIDDAAEKAGDVLNKKID